MGILEYILIGVTLGFLLEHFGKWMEVEFSFWERIGLWVFWPIALIVFMYHFLREIFRKE
jgi:predicted permease